MIVVSARCGSGAVKCLENWERGIFCFAQSCRFGRMGAQLFPATKESFPSGNAGGDRRDGVRRDEFELRLTLREAAR
jgi:hypothetical protein